MAVLVLVGSIVLIIFLALLPVFIGGARKRLMLRNMPGRKELPIIGHAHYYLGKKPHEILDEVWKAFAECGNTWKMFLLHEVQVVTTDPKVCEVSSSV